MKRYILACKFNESETENIKSIMGKLKEENPSLALVDLDSLHLTIMHLGYWEDVLKIQDNLKKINRKSFQISLNNVCPVQKDDQRDVWLRPLKALGLAELTRYITKTLKMQRREENMNFTPHITLGTLHHGSTSESKIKAIKVEIAGLYLIEVEQGDNGNQYHVIEEYPFVREQHFVYILECSDGSLYTGWTTDVEKRLADHNEGKGAKYTKAHGPCILRYVEEVESKSKALKREYEIKQLSREEKLKLVETYAKGTQTKA